MTDEIKHPPSALIGEATSLFYLLGGMAAKHLVIVGGLVPPLLVPEAADAHVGSADIDLCLSLAAKADALEGRDDSKDGYDVSWWCLNARPSGAEVATMIADRPAFKQELFQESVAQLHAAFRAPDYPGPDGYAREKHPVGAAVCSGPGAARCSHPDLQPGDEEYERARNAAYVVVSEVLGILKAQLW